MKKIQIIQPNFQMIERAHALEIALTNLDRFGCEEGFFLKAESIELYQQLNELDCLRVAMIKDDFAGFYLLIPPGHHILTRLFDSGCMDFFSPQPVSKDNSFWLAKIAVPLEYRSMGIGSALMRSLREQYGDKHFLTTTALSPRRNNAIAALLKKQGINKVGVWVSGLEAELNCHYLWHAPPVIDTD